MPIIVSISEQKLSLYRDVTDGGGLLKQYAISTAANGIGFDEGSYCTPTGRFEIAVKIGDGEELMTIFSGRKPVGRWDGEASEHDLVLTRILWLHGLDPENANTQERFIYIHGTNQEELLGAPASCGCVRMANQEMVELFDQVHVGESVEIVP